MGESKWKQIFGKQISEGACVSPDSLRADYSRAMAETCFQKASANEEEVKLLAKKEALKIFAKAQGYSEEDVKKIFMRKAVTTPEEIALLEELVKRKKAEDCPDGQHCAEFSQIPEAQLLAHLKEGWEIVKELSTARSSLSTFGDPPAPPPSSFLSFKESRC
jgi:hypothetical protein